MRREIARALKAHRKARGWSQARLAEELSDRAGSRTFTQGFVSEFEKGAKPVTVEYLALFVDALDVPLLKLLEPALPPGPRRLLDLIEEASLQRSTGKLSVADFEKVAAKARAELAQLIVEQTESAADRVRSAAGGDVGDEPVFAALVRDIAKLGPDGWLHLRPTVAGLQQQMQRRRHRDRLREGLVEAAREFKDPKLMKLVEQYVAIDQGQTTKTSRGGSKKR